MAQLYNIQKYKQQSTHAIIRQVLTVHTSPHLLTFPQTWPPVYCAKKVRTMLKTGVVRSGISANKYLSRNF